MVVVENAKIYRGPNNFAEHSHSCCEIFYLKKGQIRLNIEGKEYIPEENSIHVISPMEKHSVTCLSEEYERYIIFMNLHNFEVYFTDPMLSSILKNRPAGFKHVFRASNPELQTIFIKCTKEYEANLNCPYTNQRMANLIFELLILLYRSAPEQFLVYQDNDRLTEVQKYIDNNYDRPIRIKEIADMYFINQYYLSHSFKAFTGYSPKQYLSKVRFIHVRQLLATSNLKITEIAENTGFESINDLSRQFKNEFGISPMEFRKKQLTQNYDVLNTLS